MSSQQPVFSIIIPTYNRPEALARCLQACAAQDYPRDLYEVVVVNDGGAMLPEAALAALRERMNFTLVTQANAGPGAARNAGAAHAQGRYLAFTDDDCAPAPDWLRQLEKGLAGQDVTLVGGSIVNALPENIYSVASHAIHDLFNAHLHNGHNPRRFFTTNNLAVPADCFHALGGFYHFVAEDRDFCHRWQTHGYGMLYNPQAVVQHYQRLDLRRFYAVHFSYGRGAFHYHRERARRSGGRFRFFPLSLLLMARYPYWRLGWRAVPVAALMVLSKIANAAGFVTATWEARQRPAESHPPASAESRRRSRLGA